jgi:uncharacterized membrane protein YagU involved in acid resistance
MGHWRGITAGLVGGVIAAGAMSLVHKGFAAPSAEQQQTEDATVRVADGVSRWLVNRPVPEDKKPLAGSIVHYAFGAGVGALYGGVADVAPRVTVALGLPFGVAVWLGAHVIMVPALGSQHRRHASRPRRKRWSSCCIWSTAPSRRSCVGSSAGRCSSR